MKMSDLAFYWILKLSGFQVLEVTPEGTIEKLTNIFESNEMSKFYLIILKVSLSKMLAFQREIGDRDCFYPL